MKTRFILSYNDTPRLILPKNTSLREAELIRVSFQALLDQKCGYEAYYVYCFEVKEGSVEEFFNR